MKTERAYETCAGTDTLKEITHGNQRTKSINTSLLVSLSAKRSHNGRRNEGDVVTRTVLSQKRRACMWYNCAEHEDNDAATRTLKLIERRWSIARRKHFPSLGQKHKKGKSENNAAAKVEGLREVQRGKAQWWAKAELTWHHVFTNMTSTLHGTHLLGWTC